MTRIPSRTVDDAPAASRPLLADLIPFSPTGRLLNMHAQMAHAPVVLDAYVSIRQALAKHGTLEPPLRAALMLVAAVPGDNEYTLAVISTLALRSGWRPDQVDALRTGRDLAEAKTDALIAVIREAAANAGRVRDATWAGALEHGWTDEQLAEAFGYLGVSVFTSHFLNYAATENDLPVHAGT
jgi:hypothetical protein